MKVVAVSCLKDNYAYLLQCTKTGQVAVIDPSEEEPVRQALTQAGLRPTVLWNTHHHADHVGGNEALKAQFGLDVVAHESERERVPGQTRGVGDGETFAFGALVVRVLHVPGHTRGAVAFVVQGEGEPPVVFTGDTLFLGGCGRLFEGTAEQMHRSLSKLAALDPTTQVYCGHEYTLANLAFAASVEPSHGAIEVARAWAAKQREQGVPTVPRTIAEERDTNPFLRTHSAEIRRAVRAEPSWTDAEVFGALRRAKDVFA